MVRGGADRIWLDDWRQRVPRSSQQAIQRQLRTQEGQFSARGGAFGVLVTRLSG